MRTTTRGQSRQTKAGRGLSGCHAESGLGAAIGDGERAGYGVGQADGARQAVLIGGRDTTAGCDSQDQHRRGWGARAGYRGGIGHRCGRIARSANADRVRTTTRGQSRQTKAGRCLTGCHAQGGLGTAIGDGERAGHGVGQADGARQSVLVGGR